MSLSVYLTRLEPEQVFEANITHNLTTMAKEAGIYAHLWRPEKIEVAFAFQLIEPLTAGLRRLRADPDRFRAFDASNGWGTYDDFVPWVEKYLQACIESPNAVIRVSR